MHFAIRQLLDEPQNNLKIFKVSTSTGARGPSAVPGAWERAHGNRKCGGHALPPGCRPTALAAVANGNAQQECLMGSGCAATICTVCVWGGWGDLKDRPLTQSVCSSWQNDETLPSPVVM